MKRRVILRAVAPAEGVGATSNGDSLQEKRLARPGCTEADFAVNTVGERLLSEPAPGVRRTTLNGRCAVRFVPPVRKAAMA